MARDQGSGNPVPSLAPHLGAAVLFSAEPVSISGLFTVTGEHEETEETVVRAANKGAMVAKCDTTLGMAAQGEEAQL